jgi:hypothetical protein
MVLTAFLTFALAFHNVQATTRHTLFDTQVPESTAQDSSHEFGIELTPAIDEQVTSPDGTRLPPATQIVDNGGAVWTLVGQLVLRNGQQTGGLGTILTWCGGQIHVFGVDSQWWRWIGSGWSPVGTIDPCGSTSPPPTSGTSQDGTRVPPATQIIDNTGAVWRIAGTTILRNGQGTGGQGTILTWCSGQIHVFGVDNQWWRWIDSGWSPVGTIDPCTGSGPPQGPTPGLSFTLFFTPPVNYATSVDYCTVELRRASDGATVATNNLGKPAVVGGEISVDITTLVNPLPSGSYYAVVIAIGPGGSTPGSPSPVFVK